MKISLTQSCYKLIQQFYFKAIDHTFVVILGGFEILATSDFYTIGLANDQEGYLSDGRRRVLINLIQIISSIRSPSFIVATITKRGADRGADLIRLDTYQMTLLLIN